MSDLPAANPAPPANALHPPVTQTVQRIRCRACKHEFTGVAFISTCPECGKAGVAEPALAPPPVISGNPTCIRCGYDLAGLPPEARCSECGTLVGRSLHGNLLRYADPAYLRTLNRGGLMVYLGIIGLCCTVFAAYPAFIFATELEVTIGRALGRRSGEEVAAAMLGAFALAMVALICAGWALLASPDPAFVGHDPAAKSRRTMRVCAMLTLGLGAVLVAVRLVPPLTVLTPSRITLMSGGVGAALVPASVALFIASANYLAFLASRIPDQALVHRLRVLHIVFYLSIAAMLVTIFVGAVSPLRGQVVLLPALAWVLLTGHVVVRYAGAVERLRSVFREYAAKSRLLDEQSA